MSWSDLLAMLPVLILCVLVFVSAVNSGSPTALVLAVVIIAAVSLVVWLLALFVGRFSNVLLPLAVAAIAALVFKPYMDWLRQKLRLPGVVAVIAVFATILIPVVAFSCFFGELVVEQCEEIIRNLPQTLDRVEAWGRSRMPQVGPTTLKS